MEKLENLDKKVEKMSTPQSTINGEGFHMMNDAHWVQGNQNNLQFSTYNLGWK